MVTQATETLLPTLPPSDRDFEAYRLVKVEKKSTRDAAKWLRISQTRVCQVIARVADYLVEVTQPDDDVRREKQLAVARQVAAAEIDHCKRLAMQSFERSIGMKRIEHEMADANGKITRRATTREYFGETRYLNTIGRLSVIGSKLPPCALPITARCTDDEFAAMESEELELEVASEAVPPSAEDCSDQPSEQPSRPAQSPVSEATKREAIRLYNQAVCMMNLPEQQIPETVQLPQRPVPTAHSEPRHPTAADRKRLRREQRKQLKAKQAC